MILFVVILVLKLLVVATQLDVVLPDKLLFSVGDIIRKPHVVVQNKPKKIPVNVVVAVAIQHPQPLKLIVIQATKMDSSVKYVAKEATLLGLAVRMLIIGSAKVLVPEIVRKLA